MVYALGESWCWNGTATCNYDIVWAREFRYDGARQRYAAYDLNTTSLEGESISINSAVRTDYNGDGAYLDFQSGVGVLRQFEPGIAMIDSDTTEGDADTLYYHTDVLGTTRLMSDSSGYAATGWHSLGGPTDVLPSVYSAFGEHLSVSDPFDGESNRYGYVGAHGYQAHDQSHMRFLHVGHRYYDPASGRFLQRDPIGLKGGYNVYRYSEASPVNRVDPTGLFSLEKGWIGGIGGAILGGAGGPKGVIAGAVIGFLGGGYEEGDFQSLLDAVTGALESVCPPGALAGPAPPQNTHDVQKEYPHRPPCGTCCLHGGDCNGGCRSR